ncbi:putative PIG3 family NAD(P)H quinone oxidoreductase [Conyzicola lurida]|uniref:Putative PIG3 family NAD(P)H quinone oxidoreductase n=1 Tax=Conyzicola lurida TaxID=1172621 RepID=A0A841AJX4_9MICO|nr:putative PIG3 family NAD(P)H quinone oxidoreductase [Conyzicola lurida]
MLAVNVDHPGGPEVLVWRETDPPVAGPRDVVIDVHTAGVNNADLLQRRGHYRVPPEASTILGLEVSGIVSAVGDEVHEWSVGDRVCALLAGGGYAEQAVVSAALVLPVPERVSLTDAAALPEAVCTVFSNLAMTANLGHGQTLLVHGGGSGIGTMAIQWAKAIGARVIVTAGSEDKLRRCWDLGADVGINYREQDFVAETLRATEGRGADAVLDIVGADYLARNIESLAPDGHLVVIGSTGGSAEPVLDLGALMAKRASVSATTLRARPHEQKAAIVRAVRDSVWPLIEAGRIAPVVDDLIPMDRAVEAHRLLESGHTFGKVLLSRPAH